MTLRWFDDDDMFLFNFCNNVRFSVILFIAYLSIFKCIMLFNVFTFFWDKVEKEQKKFCDVFVFWLNIVITFFFRRMNVELDAVIKCKIDFVFQIFAIFFFFVTLILHWNDQTKWLFSQLTHLRLFVNALHATSLCYSK